MRIIRNIVILCMLHFFLIVDSVAEECKDMQYYKFNGHRKKKCKWVAKKPYQRCGKTDRNRDKVYTRCPLSCNMCTPTPDELKGTGELCTTGDQCISGVCNRGSCYASSSCQPLAFQNNVDFSENTVILVYIGSGFSTWREWREQALIMHNSVKDAEFFEGDVKYHPLFVSSLRSEGFCDYGCNGIDRLLCCEQAVVRLLSEKCFPSGPNVQSIVIHNDEKYGGAGYATENIATTSIHKVGPLLIKHELGHSLFELGDEYSYTDADSSYPNCSDDCNRWGDLNEHFSSEGGKGLCSHKGCAGNNYFIGIPSFMLNMYQPVGHVNLRFACCTFRVLTKQFPSYCSKYDEGKLDLLEFCQQDYQGYGVSSYISSAPLLPSPDDEEEEEEGPLFDGDSSESKLMYVHKPIVVQVNVEKKSYSISDIYRPEKKTFPGYFQKYQVHGDYPDMATALASNDVYEILEVKVEFNTGFEQTLYFRIYRMVSIPPLPDVDSTDSDKMDVMTRISTVQVVLNKKHGWPQNIEIEKYFLVS